VSDYGHSAKETLSSARSRTFGKGIFAECQNTSTWQSFLFFYFSTRQRELLKCGNLCRVSTHWTLSKDNIYRALLCDTRQNIFIFSFFHLFSAAILDYLELHMHGTFLELFAIFSQFISFDSISWNNSNLNCKSFREWKK
jgi:hypothetical protein